MPHHDAPPIDASGAADRLVDDMKLFLRGGPVPDESGEEPRDHTRTWDHGGATADPRDWTPSPAGQDTARDRVIGPYRVLGRAGRGGMGEVFHARHRELPLEVALKTIRAPFAGERGVRERFRVEAAAAAKLDHPNVVKLYGFDEHEGELYIAMEWAPGGDLSGRLAGGPMPPRAAAALVRTLAAAMAYAHGRGVLHRDLKPQNVLLTADGTPKVADFGLARLRADDESGGLTKTGAIIGTPPYMAPEQADGREASARTDVYALGAILYEALTGGPPFSGDSKESVLKQVRESDPPRPSSVVRGVPSDLEVICLRCLSKDAADRYQTAGELVADLDRFLSGEPIAPGPWLRLRRAGRAVRRRWRWAAVTAGVAAACVTTVLVMAALNRPPDGESTAARQALESELQAGRPAELIGAKGWPKWFRWHPDAAANRRVTLAPDGVVSAESADEHRTALLELLPDTMLGRFKLTAQVRHDWSKRAGRVGVYVGHHSYRWESRDVQLFSGVRFNDTVGHPGGFIADPTQPEGKRVLVPENTSAVDLGAFLLTDFGDLPDRDAAVASVVGRRITPRGDRSGYWHEIEITVTPAEVTAVLDGDRMALSTAQVNESARTWFSQFALRHPADSFFAQPAPGFPPRGGVGLYLTRGGVGVRNVTVTPLPE